MRTYLLFLKDALKCTFNCPNVVINKTDISLTVQQMKNFSDINLWLEKPAYQCHMDFELQQNHLGIRFE